MSLESLPASDKRDLSNLHVQSAASMADMSTSCRSDRAMSYSHHALDTARLFRGSPVAAFIKKYAPRRPVAIGEDVGYRRRAQRRRLHACVASGRVSHDASVSRNPTKHTGSPVVLHSTTPLRSMRVNLPTMAEEKPSVLRPSNASCHDTLWQEMLGRCRADSGASSQESNDHDEHHAADRMHDATPSKCRNDASERSPRLQDDLQQRLRIEKCIRRLRSRLALAIHKSSTGQSTKSFAELMAQRAIDSQQCLDEQDADGRIAQVAEDEYGRCVLQARQPVSRGSSSSPPRSIHADTPASMQSSDSEDNAADVDEDVREQRRRQRQRRRHFPSGTRRSTAGDLTSTPSPSSRFMRPLQAHRRERAARLTTPPAYRQPSRSACYKNATVAAYFATPCVALDRLTSSRDAMLKKRRKKTRLPLPLERAASSDAVCPTTTTQCNAEQCKDHRGCAKSARGMQPLDCAAAAEAMLLLHHQDN
ncbi:hypothetical protein SYNPS1DRAFT_29739 [Syncephalis pseudoplumigaleata]|uniref:Uncharacterized protein n=1 Tax=Syncephalis pseudoplumigaleata TaxID=1712513 RepID=A0A4P9YXA5_9FUNG|nr:hypothetical protein SYNPS1DRAFT_29739 [Syncephalis pseudoplumigaleata]|eukprot:RKP24495.1 hypothetical protein SYNPS1DRAFT_29739 [Syncephalis pseudoplumigaleata]